MDNTDKITQSDQKKPAYTSGEEVVISFLEIPDSIATEAELVENIMRLQEIDRAEAEDLIARAKAKRELRIRIQKKLDIQERARREAAEQAKWQV